MRWWCSAQPSLTGAARPAARSEVDPVRHLIVTATGWGLNPDKDAIYLNVTPTRNDGTTIYKLDVKDVPVDGFWSISLYNADGYFEPNDLNAYTLNNITAKKNADGSVAIQFGGCDGKIPNCLPITAGLELHGAALSPARELSPCCPRLLFFSASPAPPALSSLPASPSPLPLFPLRSAPSLLAQFAWAGWGSTALEGRLCANAHRESSSL